MTYGSVDFYGVQHLYQHKTKSYHSMGISGDGEKQCIPVEQDSAVKFIGNQQADNNFSSVLGFKAMIKTS